MKKRILGLLSSAVLLLGLTACSRGGTSSAGSTSGGEEAGLAAEKGRKLTFMLPAHNYNDSSKWENIALNAFREEHPDITLEFVSASIDNWMTKLRSAAAAGEPIDVFQDSANNNPMYALQGLNQPLQDYIDMNSPVLHRETMDSVFCYNGNYYVAVTRPSVCVIFYNKDIFENEGVDCPLDLYNAGEWTFDNLARIARELTYNNASGKRWGLACNYPYIFFGANATSTSTTPIWRIRSE